MPDETNFWNILEAGATSVAVIVAVFALLSQYCTRKRQQRQDLFDKRMAVFDALADVLEKCYYSPENIRPQHMNRIMYQKQRAKLLFAKDVADWVDKMAVQVEYFMLDIPALEHLSLEADSSRLDVPEKHRKVYRWVTHDALAEMSEKFEPFLDLRDKSVPQCVQAFVKRFGLREAQRNAHASDVVHS